MKALVMYDSFFGNTEKIANAVAGALAAQGSVETVKIGGDAPQLSGVDLLVVGSPTRGFRPSPGTKQFLASLPAGSLKGVRVAAFDTRIDVPHQKSGFLRFMVGIFGYAADPIAKGLVKKGGALAAAPEGFIVEASEGPLREGELERAAEWTRRLGLTAQR